MPTRGRPCLYGDTPDAGITWREDRLSTGTLRALQGFTQSLRDLAFPSLPLPNYTTLCRRAKRLISNCRSFCDSEPIHLVVDSTSLKVYGESEWKGAPARLLEVAHVP
ncbi:MAG: transposase [Burkholderia sp.]